MKTFFATILFFSIFPANAYESNHGSSRREGYDSQKGYAFENKCFRYEYREYYVPGNSMSPGYVKSHQEKVSVNCTKNGNRTHHYHEKTKSSPSYVNYKPAKKCSASATLGGLIGGGIAASLSHKDSYGWTIPLGAVLGAGIGNAECK